MKKIFGNIKMTWWKVVLFAVITGVYTGYIMTVTKLHDTSFQDIGISHEWWVLFAIIVVVNCKKNYEAALKCFLFFLISQPLVYATEVVLHHITMDLAITYYKYWIVQTVLTLPGGFIAYYCQKQNPFGAIVLGIGNTIEAIFCVHFVASCIKNYPHHLLSAIFCFLVIIITNIYVQREKNNRLISICTTLLISAILAVFLILTHRTIF